MTEPSLRLKVTDFLATDFEKDVFQELMKLKQLDYLSGVSFPLYFWYDRETEAVDLKTIEPFIKYWKSSEFRTKLILYPELFDTQNHFIFYDIRPKGVKPADKEYMTNYRFAYEYTNPRDIIEGLKEFKKTYEFINKDELNPEPIRKQKRND
jgi:hypothetical protein|tara:strand:- start:140 stop:595 length:456 start_codon:yes stop_codon:yes gene_type:complete